MGSSEHRRVPELAPFRIKPQFVARVWGTRDLRPWYDFVTDGEPIGEVWLTGDECRVETGSHAGKTLAELFRHAPETLLGEGAASPASPLLIKMIFAREKLSVQVHPDDTLAQKYGQPRGKTECWYALAAESGAKVAVGLKPGITLDSVREGIRAGTLEEYLNVLDVTAGDMIFVDAGTVHAIWPGSIILETQQNCDITYRMYDYGRPRELHVEKSIEATKLETRAGKVEARAQAERSILVDEDYFKVERIATDGRLTSESLRGEAHARLSYLFAQAGSGRIVGEGFEAIDLPARGIVCVPALSLAFSVEDMGGLELIRMTPNR